MNAGIVFTFISTVAYCAAGQHKFTMQKFGICLVVMGIPTFFSLSLTIMSVKMVRETGLVMILMYTSVILGYLMSMLYYNETQNPVCVVGVILIILGVAGPFTQRRHDCIFLSFHK